MKTLRRLFALLLVLIVIAVVVAATLPASTAYRFVEDRMGAVKLSGLTGTIWQGRASSAQVFGQELGALTWELHPQPLLQRVVAAQVSLDGGAIAATADVQRRIDGTIELNAGTFHFPASLAAPALDIPSLNLLGDIEGKLDHARLQGVLLSDASGSMRWKNAAVSGAAQAQLGDLEATFASATDGSIKGTAHDLGGPLQLDGTFNVSAGSFDVDAHLAARDNNAQVADALRYIGQPDADGTSHLIIHGQLFNLF
ncbi:MAG: type II secretion system protein N [Rudaea sp.]